MNIIKISEEVYRTIMDADFTADLENLPYNKFCIAFPYSFLRSVDEMMFDVMKDFKREVNNKGMGFKQAINKYRDRLDEGRKIITDYCEADLHLIFNINNNWEIILKHSKPQIVNKDKHILFHAINAGDYFKNSDIPLPPFLPIVKVNEITSKDDNYWLYKNMLKLISGVIYALNNPIYVEITESNQRTIGENTHRNKKNKKKFNNIRYITNIKYIRQDKKQTQNSGKRVFTKEAWEVEGHPRHLKSGKVTWVKSYVKGDKNKLVKEDRILKMNKIQIE